VQRRLRLSEVRMKSSLERERTIEEGLFLRLTTLSEFAPLIAC
jgi:hypothetical protein